MKKSRAVSGLLSLCLSLVCLLAGCDRAPQSSAALPESGSEPLLPADSVPAPAAPSGDPFIVSDINGNDYDLAATAWGRRYPFMIDYFRSLRDAVDAAGGDSAREAALLTGWKKVSVPEAYITAFGSPAVSLLGFDTQGAPDPDGPQLTTVIRAAALEDTTPLGAEYFESGLGGRRADGQGYLNVSLTVANTGKEAVTFYLNSITPLILVDGQIASYGPETITEMVTASDTGKATGDKSFFQCTLAPGETQNYTAVFYADRRLDLKDIYLELNYTGLYVEPTFAQDSAVCTMTGTFCALQ